MTERVCQGCGVALPPKTWQGRDRKWCSERCRKQTLYAGTCASCGGPTNGYDGPGRAADCCGHCNARRQGDLQHALGHDVALRVLNLRRNGFTNRAIAEMLGVHEQSVSRSLTRLRRQGVAVPPPPYWSRAQDEVTA